MSYALRGTDDDAPTSGSDEWNYWLSVLNDKKNELFRDVKQNWDGSHEVRSLGTITASAAPYFNLPTDFIAPSGDYAGAGAYVVNNGQRHELTLKKANDVGPRNTEIYIDSRNPQVVRFGAEITATDPLVGGTLYMPGYYMPADLTSGTDSLPFTDPLWVIYASAAEVAFGDVVYEDKAEALNTKANYHYDLMVQNNRRGIHNSPRRVSYAVRRVGMR